MLILYLNPRVWIVAKICGNMGRLLVGVLGTPWRWLMMTSFDQWKPWGIAVELHEVLIIDCPAD